MDRESFYGLSILNGVLSFCFCSTLRVMRDEHEGLRSEKVDDFVKEVIELD